MNNKELDSFEDINIVGENKSKQSRSQGLTLLLS